MGYTLYWKFETPFTDIEHELFTRCARAVIRDQIKILGSGWGDDDSLPLLTADELSLNGLADDAHETFFFEFGAPGSGFCKTSLKPYDKVVVALLIIAESVKPDFTWRSDGNAAMHRKGARLAAKVGRNALDPRGVAVADQVLAGV